MNTKSNAINTGNLMTGPAGSLQHTITCEKIYYAVYSPWNDV